jgi:hypothetical protein
MNEEFCHVCKEEIDELFWTCAIEEIGPLLQRVPKLKKICLNKDCFGQQRFYLTLENDHLRLRAMGFAK